MNTEYSYQDKLKLVEKIERIKKKKNMLEIYRIISTDNPKYVSNENGLFFNFQNLSDVTYRKLEEYVGAIKVTKAEKASIDLNFENNTRFDFLDSDKMEDGKMKFSNKEKNVIKKKKYNDYIENTPENNNIEYFNFQNYETSESEKRK